VSNTEFFHRQLFCKNRKTQYQLLSLQGTNHLGHFYLNQQLLPLINPKGRIVVTASGVHDPDSPGGAQGVPATLGDLSGFERAVVPGNKM
jgi:protochlorophyllide reductase